eukprot:c44682_g1_i1 orf=85-375(-)
MEMSTQLFTITCHFSQSYAGYVHENSRDHHALYESCLSAFTMLSKKHMKVLFDSGVLHITGTRNDLRECHSWPSLLGDLPLILASPCCHWAAPFQL